MTDNKKAKKPSQSPNGVKIDVIIKDTGVKVTKKKK